MISKPDKKPKEKTFSVADILMVTGFVILAYTTYMGTRLLTGDFTGSVVTAIIVVAVCMLLLWIICKAKKAHNHRNAWMIFEIIMVVVFAGLFLALTVNARHYVYIMSVGDSLQNDAEHDRDAIFALFDQYESQEKEDMGSIYNNIKALPTYTNLYADQETADRLKEWEGEHTIEPGKSYSQDELNSAAQAYYDVLEKHVLLGGSYKNLKSEYTAQLDALMSSIKNGSDYGQYHNMAHNLGKKYEDLAESLTSLSARKQKYLLSQNGGRLTSKQLGRTYTATEPMQLKKHFDGSAKSTAAGWWYTLGALIFIMCGYFATRRSRRITVMSDGLLRKKKSFTHDGGIDIC